MYEDLKQKLIDAGRVLYSEGLGDYVAGHVSLRLPDNPGRFLMKPAGIGLEEMSQNNIIIVDLDGMKVEGVSNRHNEVFIHSEILRARPDVNSVVHAHPLHTVAFSTLGKELRAVGNDATVFYGGVPVFSESTDLITTKERGRALAETLGKRPVAILRNHGIAATGASVQESVWMSLKLERACQMQLLAEGAGGPKLFVKEEDVADKQKKSLRQDLFDNAFDYALRNFKRKYCACCLDKEDVVAPSTFKASPGG
jgi:L-ribulose-5-phosphate 4-epimerase